VNLKFPNPHNFHVVLPYFKTLKKLKNKIYNPNLLYFLSIKLKNTNENIKREHFLKKLCYYNLDILLKIVIIVAKNHYCYLWVIGASMQTISFKIQKHYHPLLI
jgi:hypothetical protein